MKSSWGLWLMRTLKYTGHLQLYCFIFTSFTYASCSSFLILWFWWFLILHQSISIWNLNQQCYAWTFTCAAVKRPWLIYTSLCSWTCAKCPVLLQTKICRMQSQRSDSISPLPGGQHQVCICNWCITPHSVNSYRGSRSVVAASVEITLPKPHPTSSSAHGCFCFPPPSVQVGLHK